MKELATISITLATGMRQEQRKPVESQALPSRTRRKHVGQRSERLEENAGLSKSPRPPN